MHGKSSTEWAEEIERWKRSGLSRAEYAAQSGLKLGSLSYWKWHFETKGKTRLGGKRKPAKSLSFVEVTRNPKEAMTNANASSWYEVTLANGARVRVSSEFDEPSLLRLVELLERRR